MTSRRQGIDVEAAFRAIFHIDPSVDIVELMDAAIDVAAAIYPQDQFKKRTKSLVDSLDEIERMRAEAENSNPKESDDRRLQKSDECTKANDECRDDEKDNNNKVAAVAANDNEEKAALELKFENSMRRYQQGHDEIRKGKRKIQLLDLKDVPKLPPKRRKLAFCSKSRARLVRAVR